MTKRQTGEHSIRTSVALAYRETALYLGYMNCLQGKVTRNHAHVVLVNPFVTVSLSMGYRQWLLNWEEIVGHKSVVRLTRHRTKCSL
jgi:hypothetical protein